MSKSYYIEVPVTMKLMVSVDAENKDEALEKVFGADIRLDPEFDKKELNFVDVEWEMHEQIVQGNVFYGMINEIHVEEEDNED